MKNQIGPGVTHGVTNILWLDALPNRHRLRCGRPRTKLVFSGGRIPEDYNAGGVRHDLPDEFEPFAPDARLVEKAARLSFPWGAKRHRQPNETKSQGLES
jgi:hypothetical protein